MMHHALQAMRAAEKILAEKKIKYVKVETPKFEENFLQQGMAESANIWVVPYIYMVFQDEIAFIHLNDEDLALIYIITPHGYIKP